MDENQENLSPSDLEKAIHQKNELIEFIKHENSILQGYIQKNDITPLVFPVSNSEVTELTYKRKIKSKVPSIELPHRLTWEQKLYIAQSAYEDCKDELESIRKSSEKAIAENEASLEFLTHRLDEIRRNRQEVEKIITKSSSHDKDHAVQNGQLLRYFQELPKQQESVADKLRLNNYTMLNQLKRLRERLRQKEDTDELLQPVDFEQLKIENSQYLSKIDQLNTEMQKVKCTSGRIQQAVNLLKSSLHESSNEKTMIASEIAYRLEITSRVKDEQRIAKKELESETAHHQVYVKQMSMYRVPSVISYVKVKSEERDLQKKESIYKRRLKIAKMSLSHHKKLWAQTVRGTEISVA